MSYGTEVSCLDQLVSGRLVSGVRVVVEALYRRLITPRGMLAGGDDATIYGFDIAGYIGAVGTDAALATLPDQVRNECLKDDRVQDISVDSLIIDNGDGTRSIQITIDGITHDEGEAFQLTLAADALSVQFLGGLPA